LKVIRYTGKCCAGIRLWVYAIDQVSDETGFHDQTQ